MYNYIYIHKYSYIYIYIHHVFSTSSFSRWFKTYSCSQWSSECVLHIVLSGRHGEDDRRWRSPGGELRIAGAASGATSAGGFWSSETRGYSTWPDLMAQNHGVKWLVLDDLEEPSILGHLHMCLSWSVWKGKPAKSTGHHYFFFYWTDFLGVDSRHTRIETEHLSSFWSCLTCLTWTCLICIFPLTNTAATCWHNICNGKKRCRNWPTSI